MFINPLDAFGALSIPLFLSNILTVILFLSAAIFALIYTMIFYEGRRKPKRWMFLIIGLLAICLSEFGQFLIPYIVEPSPSLFSMILYTQNIGIILITAGCLILYKGAEK